MRRSSCLVAWFDEDDLVVENYLTGRQSALHHQLLPALRSLTVPAARAEALDRLGGAAAGPLLRRLLDQDLLVEVGSALDARERAVETTWPWGRDARYFHFSTRRTRFAYALEEERAALVDRARTSPQPPPFLDRGRDDVPLPPGPDPRTGLAQALRRRRTGRAFAPRPVPLDLLAAVLRLTWGATSLREDPGVGTVMLKTSPSGGARHPVEVYCVAQDVEGLQPGVYHYCCGRHVLSRLPTPQDLPGRVLAALTDQPWVQDAAAVFLMSAHIQRSGWKYAQSHAYRVLLLDAGHLGQTFHLTCTAFGLSPWTSAALDEDAAESLLGIRDPSELVIYAAACGWPAQRT